MPKQVFKIDRFDGGINDASDPRDIADSQMVSAVGIDVSKHGKLRLLGRFEQWGDHTQVLRTHATDLETSTTQVGAGLLTFSADWTGGNEAGTSQTDTITMQEDTDYIAVWSNSRSRVYIWESSDGLWGLDAADYVEPGGSTKGPTMYVVDGGLRVVDGKFNGVFLNRILMPIKRTDFKVGGSATYGHYPWAEWVWAEQKFTAPEYENSAFRIQDLDDGPVSNYEGENGDNTATDPFVSLDCHADATAGSWPSTSKIQFYYSYVYEGMQESAVTQMDLDTRVSLDAPAYRFEVRLRVGQQAGGSSKHNFALWGASDGRGPRIIGVRIYWTEPLTDIATERFLLWEGFFEKGWRFANKLGDYSAWGDATLTGLSGSVTKYYATAIPDADEVYDAPFDVETYRTLNGYEPGETVSAKFKTATVANRVVYAGNVFQDGAYYPDRILKSAVNRFDIFPESRFLDVTVNDGDSIIALMEFGDRLLEFKRRSVSIINIQGGQEFLEGTYRFKGLISESGVCKTEFGIVWANENGCYLYDGRQINDLLEKNGIRVISQDTWSTFIQDPSVGYAPKFNKIIIRPEVSNVVASDNDAYIYDTITKAWTKTMANAAGHTSMSSNFQVDHNNDLIYAFGHSSAPDGHLSKWNDDPAGQTSMEWISKDIDFGTPAVRKKVYKAYITYKSPDSAGGVTTLNSVEDLEFANDGASAIEIYECVQKLSSGDGTGIILKITLGIDGHSDAIDIIDGGSGYANSDTITIEDPRDVTGTPATDTVTVSGIENRLPTLSYAVNGGSFSAATGTFSADQTSWTRGEFTFGSNARSCHSIQLKISGNAINFEVNDISLIYRTKTVN